MAFYFSGAFYSIAAPSRLNCSTIFEMFYGFAALSVLSQSADRFYGHWTSASNVY